MLCTQGLVDLASMAVTRLLRLNFSFFANSISAN